MEQVAGKSTPDSKVFDYVIIGGGTAGLVLAARLTENPDVQVVVLEASEKRLDVT
jgi:choline dehydrogenase-like flavoprotein